MMEEVRAEDSNGDFEFVEGNKVPKKQSKADTIQKIAVDNVELSVPLIPVAKSENESTKPVEPYIAKQDIVTNTQLMTPIQIEPISSVQTSSTLNMDSIVDNLSAATQSKSVWGWITNSQFLNRVAEKAKNSVDSMITTLDPGMKEFIYSGGDIDVIVASTKDLKVVPIRDAFQSTFGRATVAGSAANVESMAPQPVGYTSGLKSAEERINLVRQQTDYESQAVVGIEGFLVEITPDRWFDTSCLVLRDSRFETDLQVFTQPTPVPPEYIAWLQNATPPDYPLLWSGFSKTIGDAARAVSGLDATEWHEAVTGISRKELIVTASKALAGMYKLALRNI